MNILANLTGLFSGPGAIVLLALVLLFGAKKLPELGRSLGETVREFTKSKEEREEEERKKLEEKKKVEV
jgi:sec-independent protein translocase protein TatA